MSSGNILRLLNEAIRDGGAIDITFGDDNQIKIGTGQDVSLGWDGTNLSMMPILDDSLWNVGNGTLSMDLMWFGSAATRGWSWDASANTLKLEDNSVLAFGTNNGVGPTFTYDAKMYWDTTNLVCVPTVDDSVIKFGTGTVNWDMWVYGNTADNYILTDASLDTFELRGAMRPRGLNCISRRYELKWVAGGRGKPGINANIQDASEAVRMIADPDFELLGLNAVTTCSAFNAEGGITLTTTTGSADQVILAPHLDANQTCWAQITWGTDQETVWETHIKTGATLTTLTIWAGLKLTNTSVTATDAEQAFFRFQPSVNSGKWQAVYSIGGTDTETDSAFTAVAASTEYHLKIAIDSARVAKFFINGTLVATSTALTTTTDLIPYVGVQTDTTAARLINVFGQSIGRKIA